LLAEEQILSWRIGTQAVELLLSRGRVLRLFCAGDVVDCVFDEKALLPEAQRVFAPQVQLELENGDRVVWRPDELLANRSLVAGLFLAPTTTLLSLGVRGRGEVQFAQMADEFGQRMLYFEEE